MPENMFDRLFGLGVKEKVFVLTYLVWVGTLLDARPLCKFSVIRAKGCLAANAVPIIAAIRTSVMSIFLVIFGRLSSDVS
jgi:hypothetical protein